MKSKLDQKSFDEIIREELDNIEESRPKSSRTKDGKKVPGKYLTKDKSAMKGEIERVSKLRSDDPDAYGKWKADYKGKDTKGGKPYKTKKSAATIAYEKKFGKKKNEQNNLNEVRAIIRELIQEQYVVSYILTEGVFDDVLKKVKEYGKKGLMTAAVLAGLMGSQSFGQMTPQQQNQIKQTAQIEMSDNKSGNEQWVDVTDKSQSKIGQKWSGNVYTASQSDASQTDKNGKSKYKETNTWYNKQQGQTTGAQGEDLGKSTSQSISQAKEISKSNKNPKLKFRSYDYLETDKGEKTLSIEKDGKFKTVQGNRAERKFNRALDKYGKPIADDIASKNT